MGLGFCFLGLFGSNLQLPCGFKSATRKRMELNCLMMLVAFLQNPSSKTGGEFPEMHQISNRDLGPCIHIILSDHGKKIANIYFYFDASINTYIHVYIYINTHTSTIHSERCSKYSY